MGYVAEIPYVANRSILRNVSIPADNTGTVVPVDINIASPKPPTQDVPVTVAIDQAALTAYNSSTDSTFAVLPSAAYQLTNPTVTVAGGQRIATVNITIIGSQIPSTGVPYALPISITTVPDNVVISANTTHTNFSDFSGPVGSLNGIYSISLPPFIEDDTRGRLMYLEYLIRY